MDAVPRTTRPPIDQLRALYRFMAERDFVASKDELVTQGFSASRIKNWVRSGRLVTIVRSVYCYGRDVETPQAVWRAALLASGPGTALVGRSASEALEIVKPERGLPKLVEVGSPVGQGREFNGLSPSLRNTTIKVVKRDFQPTDLLRIHGLQVQRAAFALTDFAASATVREVRFAFLEACRLGLFDRADLQYCFVRLAHRRGARKLRPFLAL